MLPIFLWKLANIIPKGPSDIIHLHCLSSPTIRTPTHFNKSFILNQKHKGGLKPQHFHGLAKVHSPQVRAEEMSLVLLINPLPFGKLGFLVRKQTQGLVFPPQNSLYWSTSTQPTFIQPTCGASKTATNSLTPLSLESEVCFHSPWFWAAL